MRKGNLRVISYNFPLLILVIMIFDYKTIYIYIYICICICICIYTYIHVNYVSHDFVKLVSHAWRIFSWIILILASAWQFLWCIRSWWLTRILFLLKDLSFCSRPYRPTAWCCWYIGADVSALQWKGTNPSKCPPGPFVHCHSAARFRQYFRRPHSVSWRWGSTLL